MVELIHVSLQGLIKLITHSAKIIQHHYHTHTLNKVIMGLFVCCFGLFCFAIEQKNVQGQRNNLPRKLADHLEIASDVSLYFGY